MKVQVICKIGINLQRNSYLHTPMGGLPTLLVSGMTAWFAFIFSMLGLWRNCFTLLMEEGAEGSVVRLGEAIQNHRTVTFITFSVSLSDFFNIFKHKHTMPGGHFSIQWMGQSCNARLLHVPLSCMHNIATFLNSHTCSCSVTQLLTNLLHYREEKYQMMQERP